MNSLKELRKAGYPAIIYALIDKEKRKKLKKICESLSNHNVLHKVNYGISGVSFNIVEEMLEATKGGK